MSECCRPYLGQLKPVVDFFLSLPHGIAGSLFSSCVDDGFSFNLI